MFIEKKTYSKMKRKLFTLLSILSICYYASGQTVNIPDSSFKAALVSISAINTNNDSEIQTAEALAFTGQIAIVSSKIKDATGIEAFKNITKLNLYNNLLDSIDLSKNTKLTLLALNQNKLQKLDLSNNPNIVTVHLDKNSPLDTLNFTGVVDLEEIFMDYSYVKYIDVTQNAKLKRIDIRFSNLKTIDLSGCPNLEFLKLDRCNVKSLDLSKNTKLTRVEIAGNSFSSPLLLDKNIALEHLDAHYARIEELDVSKNVNLTYFEYLEKLDDKLQYGKWK